MMREKKKKKKKKRKEPNWKVKQIEMPVCTRACVTLNSSAVAWHTHSVGARSRKEKEEEGNFHQAHVRKKNTKKHKAVAMHTHGIAQTCQHLERFIVAVSSYERAVGHRYTKFLEH